jgi:hypothetical protein
MNVETDRPVSTRDVVLAWLGRPTDVRVVETHSALLFFVGDRVFKVKKALDLGFLDFTTLDARRAACAAEVTLNRRLAPDVYLGVADITDAGGRVRDHAVVMHRMPEQRRLSTMLRRGENLDGPLRAIARLLAEFHTRCATTADIRAAGSPAAIRGLWDEGLTALDTYAGSILPIATVDEIGRLARRFLAGRTPLLHDRQRGGHVRDGHGDLLADDIFCLPDGPRILDCLEFDQRLRVGDVLGDVAFLAMDLERLGAPDHAADFLRAYGEFSGETHPAPLADFYIGYRAFVRAKVACVRATQTVGDAAASASEEARRLVQLTLDHLRRARVRLILVGGLPGTGKTTVASAIADRYDGRVLLRSDVIRKEVAGIPADQAAPAPYGAGIYDAATTDRTYDELLRRARTALGRGGTVLLDASWADRRHRDAAARLAVDTSADLVELHATLSPAVAAARIERRAAAGGDASDATAKVMRAMTASFDPWAAATPISTAVPLRDSVRAALRVVDQPTSATRTPP